MKPFDHVLVRWGDDYVWEADIFSRKKDDGRYICIGDIWNQCIPYEGNERLLGTPGVPEPEWFPEKGELVAVRNDNGRPWVARVFDSYNPDSAFRKWLCVAEINTDGDVRAWEYCEPLDKHFVVRR